MIPIEWEDAMKYGLKKLSSVVCCAALLTAVALFSSGTAFKAQAAGATQEAFICDWFGDPGCTQAPGFGKVLWVQPAGKNKVNVTYVLNNLIPGTEYQLGIKIFGGPGNNGTGVASFEPFGQLPEWGGAGGNFDVYLPGIVIGDAEGDASFHINIKNVDVAVWCGILEVIFFVDPAADWDITDAIPLVGTASDNVTDSILADFGSCPATS